MRTPRSSAPAAGPQHVPVAKFKVKVAAYLRAVERTGGTLVVTNRGRPIATITSASRRPGNTFVGSGRSAIRIPGGTTFPPPPESWGIPVRPDGASAAPPSAARHPASSVNAGEDQPPPPISAAPATPSDDAGL